MVESLKEAQRNWIGKSEGVQLKLDILKDGKKISDFEIFTTCIETVYGITFAVLAPENDLIEKLAPYITNMDAVREYQRQTALRSEFDRKSQVKDKTGCKLEGIYAVNPVNGKQVEMYIADFRDCFCV